MRLNVNYGEQKVVYYKLEKCSVDTSIALDKRPVTFTFCPFLK